MSTRSPPVLKYSATFRAGLSSNALYAFNVLGAGTAWGAIAWIRMERPAVGSP
jgi:hypothetical protein